ncbi:MAG: TIGR03668 family PPOX class F420-dependent oxidoreductase [Candidatus Rokubacteria bacterium]|nr:TIGR03668 family PPOX class F420-dependent oxidoreductase [Candidatus Rokubacteria bacterium]
MLATARVARLATADRAGQPLVVPVCYAFVDGRIYSAVDAKPKRTRELRRLRDIADNPRVSLVVDVWDEDWARLAWVLVEGTAGILTTDLERTPALAALVAKYPQYAAMDLLSTAGPVIAITPARVVAWRAAG